MVDSPPTEVLCLRGKSATQIENEKHATLASLNHSFGSKLW